MANTCSLTNKGLVTALNTGTCLVKVQTHNKKYSAICRITVVADTPIPSSDWSSNEDNILLHGSGGNTFIHSVTTSGAGGHGYGLEINSSGRWSVSSNKSWITPTETWSGNSAVNNYGLFFNVAENNENISRVATLTGTNLDTNDTSTFTVTQEMKVAESQIKLFITSGNLDFTNGTITIGDNFNSQQITVTPKIYQNGSWSNYNFAWGGSITSNSDYVQYISPTLSGGLSQFNTSKELTVVFITERTSDKNVVLQVKSNTTTSNQALSTVTFSVTKNVSDINGKMDIRLFYGNTEIEEGEEITVLAMSSLVPVTIKTYLGVGTTWVEDNTRTWGASVTVNSQYFEKPKCIPTLTSEFEQFAGSEVLNFTFYTNTHPDTCIFNLDIFSYEDGSGYFGGFKRFKFKQMAGSGNYNLNPVIINPPSGYTVSNTMTSPNDANMRITTNTNSSENLSIKINTNIYGCTLIYDTELSSSEGFLRYNGANYSNSTNNYIPRASDTDEMKTLIISLNAVTGITNKNLVLSITTPNNIVYTITINIVQGVEEAKYLDTNTYSISAVADDETALYGFTITSNISWAITWPSIILAPLGQDHITSGGTGDQNITFSVSENESTSPRTANIVISPADNSGVSPVTIVIQQAAAETQYYLNVSPTSFNNFNGEDTTTIYSFNIISNIEWQISWPDIVDNPFGEDSIIIAGQNNSEILFSLKQNTTGSTRTADISIIPDINSPNYSLYSDIQPVTITLSQNPARSLTVNESAMAIPQNPGNTVYSFNITSNINWQITWSESWLLDQNGGTNLTTNGNGNSTVNFTVSDNSGNSRTATITIKTSDSYIVRTITITQAGEVQTPQYSLYILVDASTSDLGPDYVVNIDPDNYMCRVNFTCGLIKKTSGMDMNSTDWYSANPTNYLYMNRSRLQNTIATYPITNSTTISGQFTETLSNLKTGIYATVTIPSNNVNVQSQSLTPGKVYKPIIAGVIHSTDIFMYDENYENILLKFDFENFGGPSADMNPENIIRYATTVNSFTTNFTISDSGTGWLFLMTNELLSISVTKGSNNNNIPFNPFEAWMTSERQSRKVYFYVVGADINSQVIFDIQGYRDSYADNYTLYVSKT